jgi:hypothetical protein
MLAYRQATCQMGAPVTHAGAEIFTPPLLGSITRASPSGAAAAGGAGQAPLRQQRRGA